MAVTDDDVLATYPWAAIDHDTLPQWKGYLEHRLLMNRCLECGYWINPPRPMCPKCWSDRIEPQEVSGKAKVQWFTLMHAGVPDHDSTNPYPAVAVELDEQVNLRMDSTVVECRPEDITCDMALELTWQDPDGESLPVFRPADPDLRSL